MNRMKITKNFLTLAIAVCVWSTYSMIALASPKEMVGIITVTGQASVNGQSAVSNSSVTSGSTIVTAAGSTAIVNIGALGKIELFENSNLTLKFSEMGITGILSAGKVNVSSAAGVATTITTKDAAVIGDAGQANNFIVEVECSHTHADTLAGLVTMRSGTNDKQVAAGTDAISGNLSQTGCKPCYRPGNTGSFPVAGLGAGALAAILIALAGGVGTAIILGGGGGTITPGGGTVVVSPVR